MPDGKIFVMGDHRATSADSRNTAVGCVADEQIVGRVLLRVWPLNAIGTVKSYDIEVGADAEASLPEESPNAE